MDTTAAANDIKRKLLLLPDSPFTQPAQVFYYNHGERLFQIDMLTRTFVSSPRPGQDAGSTSDAEDMKSACLVQNFRLQSVPHWGGHCRIHFILSLGLGLELGSI